MVHQWAGVKQSTGQSRHWAVYSRSSCGGAVTATAAGMGQEVTAVYPSSPVVDEAVPERPRMYLAQAIDSLHAPVGAIVLAASAVDSMLKTKGLKEGSLNQRIDRAASTNLITAEMTQWAHDVRLDANDQRHADEDAPLPTVADAQRVIAFTEALAEFLFVLPAMVQRGKSIRG